MFWGRGNAIGAIGHSLYQGAALWLGLMVGGFLFRRREHRVPRTVRKQIEKIEERLGEWISSTSLLIRHSRLDSSSAAVPTPSASPTQKP